MSGRTVAGGCARSPPGPDGMQIFDMPLEEVLNRPDADELRREFLLLPRRRGAGDLAADHPAKGLLRRAEAKPLIEIPFYKAWVALVSIAKKEVDRFPVDDPTAFPFRTRSRTASPASFARRKTNRSETAIATRGGSSSPRKARRSTPISTTRHRHGGDRIGGEHGSRVRHDDRRAGFHKPEASACRKKGPPCWRPMSRAESLAAGKRRSASNRS